MRSFTFLVILQTILAVAQAQTATVIPADAAAAHVGEYATVEGVVAKVFTSKSGNTFLNIGGSYPNQTFTGWIPPASPVSKSPILSGQEGQNHRGDQGWHTTWLAALSSQYGQNAL